MVVSSSSQVCFFLSQVKDLLCIIARRANQGSKIRKEVLKTEPCWLPATFNMKTELPQLVAFFLAQKKL